MSEAPPRVDIGMPTRGAAPYLDEAIESVLGQTFGNWSLFVSENGPGELEERLRPYLGDSRIRFSPTGEDLGAARNHTRLIEAGDAPYVAILHDDDRWQPEWLERRIDFLEQHPECGFVFGGNREIDEESRETVSSELVLAEGVHRPEEVVPLLLGHNIIGIPTVLARRRAYEAVGAEFTEETVSFDYEMWLRLALRFPVGYLAVRDADYRVHSSQVTMTNRKRGEDQVRLVERIRSLVAEAPGVEGDDRLLRRRLARAHLSAALDAVQAPDRPGARRHLRTALKEYPPSALDPRTAAVVAGFVLGRRGRRALDRARYLVLRKRLRVHLRR